MRRCWRREEVQESQGPRVLRSRGPKVRGSKGPRYLKLTFKYELDSKDLVRFMISFCLIFFIYILCHDGAMPSKFHIQDVVCYDCYFNMLELKDK